MSASPTALRRRLGLGDAVVIGAGSMVGAGVFAAWSPAAEAAGTGLLVGLLVAAGVALCNAVSSAQLAALYPESGGTYVYGRYRLGAAVGHLAGWGFVIGKTASCAAMAMTAGAYLWPAQAKLVGVAAVLGIVVVNIGGLTRTAAVARVLLGVTLVTLAAVVVAGWSSSGVSPGRITPIDGGVLDILRAGGFLFFAFAGYARIATLGEEVLDPESTIPRAITRALGAVLALYLVVAVTALAVVPASALASTDAPLRLVVEAGPLGSLAPALRVGAGVASLGVLLNLILGVSRTVLAMARRRELPGVLAHVDPARALPLRAELTVSAAVIVVVALADLRGAIGFSAVAVLTYYAIANASALTLPAEQRRWPLAVSAVGLAGCAALVATLPVRALVGGLALLAAGALVRAITARRLAST